jgi:hypothetical protein
VRVTPLAQSILIIGKRIEAGVKHRAARTQLHTAVVASPWGYAAQRTSSADEYVRFVLRQRWRPEGIDDPDGNEPVGP